MEGSEDEFLGENLFICKLLDIAAMVENKPEALNTKHETKSNIKI